MHKLKVFYNAMRKVLNSRFIYWTKVVIVGLTVGVGFQLLQAWTGPSQSPPNGNVAGPLTTSAIQQTKSGTLVLGTDLAVSRNTVLGQFVSTSNTTGLCLSGTCYTTWPTAPVTTVSGSGGITVSATTGNVVVSANTGILQSRVNGTCPAGQAVNVINADGTVSCQSTGGSITSISGASGITVSPTTGAVIVAPDTNYMQRRISSTCSAGQSIRAIAADGTVTCEVDDNSDAVSAVTAGTGIFVSPTTGTVIVSADTSVMQRRIASSCPAGESMRAIGADGSVTCEVDDVGTDVPSGAIMMFVAACPSGWSEYTAMRGRFARGEDSGDAGSLDQGGSDDEIVVSHTHHTVAAGVVNNDLLGYYPHLAEETTAGGDTEYDLGGTYSSPTLGETSVAGSDGTGANKPRFQEVIYCMKS